MNPFKKKDFDFLYICGFSKVTKGVFIIINLTKQRAEAHFAKCSVTREYTCLEYSFKDLEVDVNTGLVDFTGFRENIVKKVEIRLAQTNNYAFGGKQEEQDDKKNGQT